MTRRPKSFGKRIYKDNRDWKRYNEELVVRWTFFLDFSFVEDWDKELEKMNRGKRGGQYLFPDSFMHWLAIWHQLVNYRGLEGIARKLSELQLIPYYEDFSTAWHRIHNFTPEIKLPAFKKLNVSGDGTG
ncbi:transposase, IS4 family protein, partial [mine drainage metagenome]